jgi:MFS family permease
MSQQSASRRDPLSSEAAVNEVWGASRSWLALAVILVGGAVGWGVAVTLPGAGAAASSGGEWLRPWACAGYGLAVGGLVALLPRLASLVSLGRRLPHRPAAEDAGRPWWPLPLLASALRETPALRRTPEDFRLGVAGFVAQARSLLAQRLWPACLVAFAVPVFGLISSWISWQVHLPEAIRRAQEQAQPGESVIVTPAVDWGGVAAPMIVSISLALVLMLGIVLVDQLTRRLLLRWAATVRMLDAESPLVQERLAASGEIPPARPPHDQPRTSREAPPAPPREIPPPLPPPPKPEPQISAQELEGLGDLFRNG